jgi:hypothetical protein
VSELRADFEPQARHCNPVLARRCKTLTLAAMKFLAAILIYAAMAALLGAGILLLVAGKPWLLIIGAVGFIVAFGRIGCMPR